MVAFLVKIHFFFLWVIRNVIVVLFFFIKYQVSFSTSYVLKTTNILWQCFFNTHSASSKHDLPHLTFVSGVHCWRTVWPLAQGGPQGLQLDTPLWSEKVFPRLQGTQVCPAVSETLVPHLGEGSWPLSQGSQSTQRIFPSPNSTVYWSLLQPYAA